MVKDGKILGLVVQDPFKMGYEGINSMVTKLRAARPWRGWTSRPGC